MKSSWLIKELSHHFLTERCVICKTKLLTSERGICLQCIYKLPRTNNFNKPDNDVETLISGRFPFIRIATFSIFTKEGYLQLLIHELKYKNKPFIGELIGDLFGRDLLQSDFIKPIEVIVPVPLHPIKKQSVDITKQKYLQKGYLKLPPFPFQ